MTTKEENLLKKFHDPNVSNLLKKRIEENYPFIKEIPAPFTPASSLLNQWYKDLEGNIYYRTGPGKGITIVPDDIRYSTNPFRHIADSSTLKFATTEEVEDKFRNVMITLDFNIGSLLHGCTITNMESFILNEEDNSFYFTGKLAGEETVITKKVLNISNFKWDTPRTYFIEKHL